MESIIFMVVFFANNKFPYKPAPAKILNIVLEGQLLCISESLGRRKGEGEEEKEHVGVEFSAPACLLACLTNLCLEYWPLAHRKCISGSWDRLESTFTDRLQHDLNLTL